DHMDKQRVFARRKLIHTLRPKWNRETEEQHRLDQDDRKLQMRRDTAPHTQRIRPRLPTFPESDQHVNKIRRPSNKKTRHEPVTKLEDVIDLISVRGGVRRLSQTSVDQREATHICSNLPQ